MKILQINASYKPAYIYGGPTMSVAKLSEQLVNAGHQVTVYTTTANGHAELPVAPNKITIVDGVNVIYFKRLTGDHTHLSPALLIKLWRNATHFNLIHIHAWWNLVSVLAALIAVLRKVPVIISPRGTLSAYSFGNKNTGSKQAMHGLLGKAILRKSYLHATSSAEEDDLLKLVQPKGIFKVPNFVRIAQTIAPKTKSDVLRLLFLSRIDEKKGLDILLQALPQVAIPYHLTVVGDGDQTYISQLKAIAADNKTHHHITWLGFKTDNKFDIYAGHDLLVLPSHNENFGNVVIESLSAGTPVLVSRHVGLANYVVKNNLGWACAPQPDAVSHAINTIAEQPGALTRISETAPNMIRNDFNDDTLAQQYIDMYQQIITHGNV